MRCGCVRLCGDVEEEVKRWSGGEKSGGAWAHGWHLGRVLKVGISGPAQRRQKCLPIDAAGERERENSRDVARRVEANIRKYVYTSGEGLIVFARYEYREGVRNARERERGFRCFPHVPRLPQPCCVISTPKARDARLSPKQTCHRDHGKTWPGTHLPLKTKVDRPVQSIDPGKRAR